VVDIENISLPSSATVILKEKLLGRYARASIDVDILRSKHTAIKFDIRPIETPIKSIPKTSALRQKIVKV